MEDGLRVGIGIPSSAIYVAVLILVLMEDGLRARNNVDLELQGRLNPCFNGRWSARGKSITRRLADL